MFNQKTIAVVILSIWFLAIAGLVFGEEAASQQTPDRGNGRGQRMGRQHQEQQPLAAQRVPAPEAMEENQDRPLPPQGQFDRPARQEQFRRGMAPQAGRPGKGMKKQFKRGGQMGNQGWDRMPSPRGQKFDAGRGFQQGQPQGRQQFQRPMQKQPFPMRPQVNPGFGRQGQQQGWDMAGRPMPFAGQQGFGGLGQQFGAGRDFPQRQPQCRQYFQRPMQNQPAPMRPQMNPGLGRQGQQQGWGMAGRPMPFAGGQGFGGCGQGFNFLQLSPQARQQMRQRFEQLPPEKRQQIRQRLQQRLDESAAPMPPRMRPQFGNPRQEFTPRDDFWTN